MRGDVGRASFLRRVAFSVLLVGLLVGGRAAPAEAMLLGPSVIDGITAFQSNDRQVRVDMFVPRDQAHPLPSVILLHGASGIGSGQLIYGMAEALAESGFAVFTVHYFDAIPSGNRAAPSRYHLRDQVVGDAIDYVASLHFVDPNRIGLFGYSLGAFQALGRASHDGRVRAVVAVAGAMDGRLAGTGISSMPPTLILHGDRDRVVSVNRARQTARVLDAVGAPYELQISNGASHVPRGAVFDDWMQRAAAFFAENLSPRQSLPRETVLLRAPGRR